MAKNPMKAVGTMHVSVVVCLLVGNMEEKIGMAFLNILSVFPFYSTKVNTTID